MPCGIGFYLSSVLIFNSGSYFLAANTIKDRKLLALLAHSNFSLFFVEVTSPSINFFLKRFVLLKTDYQGNDQRDQRRKYGAAKEGREDDLLAAEFPQEGQRNVHGGCTPRGDGDDFAEVFYGER